MIDALQDFASSFPEFLQWFGVMIVAAIPFVESYFGSLIGVVIGLPPAVAIGAAVVGNILSMLVFVFTAHGARTKAKAVASRRRSRALVGAGVGGADGASTRPADASSPSTADAAGAAPEPAESPRREKLRRAFDKYGVAGVSLIGQTMLPSQITSAAMVSFGANRNTVILWQVISISLWGVVFGVLASLGVSLAG
ncbi:hypothetical protein BJ978_001586 [Agromyces terreus]|uniref:Small multidrug efflux protein n=1 Tax=Agromyces terreus TaxID=424795 RepID=A0A9X2H1H8_9MICO|nr:hypothetical protein [Agromyces terreus]MCP2370910.1 hypothetical protein [Agromyces terreus]